MTPSPEARALAEAALRVAERQAQRLDRLKAALLAGNDVEALRFARVAVGLEEDDRSDESEAGT